MRGAVSGTISLVAAAGKAADAGAVLPFPGTMHHGHTAVCAKDKTGIGIGRTLPGGRARLSAEKRLRARPGHRINDGFVGMGYDNALSARDGSLLSVHLLPFGSLDQASGIQLFV